MFNHLLLPFLNSLVCIEIISHPSEANSQVCNLNCKTFELHQEDGMIVPEKGLPGLGLLSSSQLVLRTISYMTFSAPIVILSTKYRQL